jgi:phosphatidylserine/phosphatidylglycerophosphate/cardiolipin synthase-like enzyme
VTQSVKVHPIGDGQPRRRSSRRNLAGASGSAPYCRHDLTTETEAVRPMSDPGHAEEQWFLGVDERGNPHTDIDRARDDGRAWTGGNSVTALVHGAEYFARLLEVLGALGAGDMVLLTDWRGDGDERLGGDEGTELATVLVDLVRRGVDVRALVWRSHPDEAHFSEEEAVALAEAVNEAGGEVLLDERVRRAGSHHQKLVLVRRAGGEDEDVAFVGGIDLCHGRRDDERHRGDPQAVDMDERYGVTPPWHDVQLEIRGPAVGDLAVTFRERWDDPTPLDHRNPWRAHIASLAREPRRPEPLPELPATPGPAGDQAVQVLRTYPSKRPPYAFAPDGERSIARAYAKAFRRARRLIYIEDQYLWSAAVAGRLADALGANPDLRLIALVPRYPEQGGLVTEPPELVGHQQAVDLLRDAGGDRVAVYDLENDEGTPVYVHAKACIVDDVWATVGSDNLNLRSWTHDSELSCAVIDGRRDERDPRDPGGAGDGARVFARELRLRLTAEHLGCSPDDPALVDPARAFDAWRAAAEALDQWHVRGRRGPRPPGRVRPHHPERLPRWTRWWAPVVYRLAVDPDGRPRALRGTDRF